VAVWLTDVMKTRLRLRDSRRGRDLGREHEHRERYLTVEPQDGNAPRSKRGGRVWNT